MRGKTVAGGNFIEYGRGVVTAAVLATFLAKDGDYHILTSGSAEQACTEALYNQRR